MPKKKRILTRIYEYARNANTQALSKWTVEQIFGKNAYYGVGKFITCNRDAPKELSVQFTEFHGKIAGTGLHEIASDTWEAMECEIIIIPRKRLLSLRTKKDDLPMMNSCTAQMLYLGSILGEMENHYYFKSDRDADIKDESEIIHIND